MLITKKGNILKMKIICNKILLSDMINTVQKAVSTKSTMPILECIKIKADINGTMTVTGNNLDLCIEYINKCNISESGEIAVSSRMFGEIIRRMPEGDINISVEEKNDDGTINYIMKIKNGDSEFNIQGLDAAEYPPVPEDKEIFNFSISQETLKTMVRTTLFCVAPEASIPILTGALFEIKNGDFSVVSTDKSRLAIVTESVDTNLPDSRFVIPSSTLRELIKILDDDNEVRVTVAERHVFFDFDNFKVITRLLDGEFINYAPILNMESTVFAVVDTKQLCESLERASLLINDDISAKTRRVPVILNIDFDKIEINCMTGRGMVHDVVNVELEGEGLRIGFNNRYMLEALRASEEDSVRMAFRDAQSACFIRSADENERYTYVVLPVRQS